MNSDNVIVIPLNLGYVDGIMKDIANIALDTERSVPQVMRVALREYISRRNQEVYNVSST